MVAAGTIDDFVQSVLERKAALVNAVVEGKALDRSLTGDVLEELQRALRTATSGLTTSPEKIDHDALIERLLAQARQEIEDGRSSAGDEMAPRSPGEMAALKRALEALAAALTGPAVGRYAFASSSKAGVEYELTVDGSDVSCNCAGFEYRGQCRHARDLKAALAAGLPVPPGYRPVSSYTV
jgi:hypothetical protein